MPRQTRSIFALNRGIISKRALARIDLPRTALSAEVMKNWMANTLGSMSLRPGLEFKLTTPGNALSKTVPFIFTHDDRAELELTANAMRVLIDDVPIARVTVTAAVTNGNFTANIAGWTGASEPGAFAVWASNGGMGVAKINGTGSAAGILRQQVAISQTGTEHALRIIIAQGPLLFRLGTAAGLDDIINETFLGTGSYSLAFTPAGDVHISLMNRRAYSVLVDSVNIEAAGEMSLTAPWGEDNFEDLRVQQRNEVVYFADRSHQQYKVERRAVRSWGLVKYEPETGPFRGINTTPITMTPSAINGDITLTASKDFFKSTHVGALFRHQSSGQTVTADISSANVFTDAIRVVGVGGQRIFGVIVITGPFVGTVTLQYSVGAPGSWVDSDTFTTDTSTSHDDGLDNQVIYYRIGVKTGEYTSGDVQVILQYSAGSITGIARVTAYSSPTVVSAIVLQDFGATTASEDWWEGSWSDFRGWPSSVAIVESRDAFAGRGGVWLSISDSPEDFDDTFEGDAGPIARSIADGAFEIVPWLLALEQLVIGSVKSSADIEAIKIDGESPFTARSSSFDEPLTPTNFNIKTSSPEGAFIDTSRTRLMWLRYDLNENGYKPEDMSVGTPDLNKGDKKLAQIRVQYRPDKRAHCRRDDGTVAVLVFDRAENLVCWLEIETDGVVEDISILPGADEDEVRYTIRRTVNGATVRFREKFSLEDECTGFPSAYLCDAHLRFSSASETTVITGLSHLEGRTVSVWGWNETHPVTLDDGTEIGVDLGTYTVSGGQITVTQAITNACVGLAYTAPWKSAKQEFAAALGTPLNVVGKIDHLGLILNNTHARGLRYGPDFDSLSDMPLIEQAQELDENHMWEDFDEPMIEFEGEWMTDSRVCLQAASPRPCTILAIGVALNKNG
jgi:hypothetical protein